MVRQARWPFLSFAFLATGVYAAAMTLERMRPALRSPEIVSLGLLVDLLVVVPLAFYLLAVRRAGWAARTLIPLFLFSLTGAAWVLPEQREMLKRLSEVLSIPAETAQGPYGKLKQARWISMGVDDAKAFREALDR